MRIIESLERKYAMKMIETLEDKYAMGSIESLEEKHAIRTLARLTQVVKVGEPQCQRAFPWHGGLPL